MIDPTNLDTRLVITPDGEGQLIDMDDKKHPTMCLVSLKPAEGRKLGISKMFDIEDVQEVEK